MTLVKLKTHITHTLVAELARFISCKTALCFSSDLSVTNDEFEHAHYALPHCALPYKPLQVTLC